MKTINITIENHNDIYNKFNDEFLNDELDKNIIYHCGTSINRIGYKTFSITKIGDNEICQALIDKIEGEN